MDSKHPKLPDQCNSYKVLNNPNRKSSYESIWDENTCDKVGKRNTIPDWKGKNWYRFEEPSGTKMSEKPVPNHKCGFYVTGWVKGSHPKTLGEMKHAKVCFNYSGNDCYWSNSIKILNCGSYFVYELPYTPGCSLGYCSVE